MKFQDLPKFTKSEDYEVDMPLQMLEYEKSRNCE